MEDATRQPLENVEPAEQATHQGGSFLTHDACHPSHVPGEMAADVTCL
ncbi:hypothetical protein [Mesorhizobium qingshengii]|uniref:Uncharacterized protein n=1 Tax=Mesorhizobium qingshengii TaxID=1165689 RepID=A0A1G5Z287_9HYPH|nr:hypothetical protein [Mesorhizobium qingshengii]SDA88951.1 hypothetical protein SAMN02927914_04093 [Mesorhizobium qingshengii]